MLRDPWQAISQSMQHCDTVSDALSLIEELNHLTPPTFPGKIKQLVLQAKKILQRHHMHSSVDAARIVLAYISIQTGEEIEAIIISEKIISESISLSPEFLSRLIYILGTAYARVGELDYAYKLVTDHGVPVAQASRDKLPGISSQMLWLKSQILWEIYLFQNHSELWYGPPPNIGWESPNYISPSPKYILEQLHLAKNLLPAGTFWPFNEILILTLKGLTGSPAETSRSVIYLENLSRLYSSANPVVSGWSLLGAALVNFKSGNNTTALSNSVKSGQIAKHHQIGALLRCTLVYETHLRELTADYSGALNAQKDLCALHLHSIYSGCFHPDNKILQFTHGTRKPSPTHVHKAIEYINNSTHKKINVLQVAEHCQINRRTLELQFKKHTKNTIAKYIKKKRMELATDLLLKGEMPMYRLAEILGYSSQSVFSREFSKHHGLSPRSWLQNHRKDLNNHLP